MSKMISRKDFLKGTAAGVISIAAAGVLGPGLVAVAEEEKGNALVKDTFPLLKEQKGLNFIGSVEARDIPGGAADVIVCDAFVGNVILKMYEGTAQTLLQIVKKGMMSSLRSKIGALLVKPALKSSVKMFDSKQYGGAPLLGIMGLVVKTHGNAMAAELKNAVGQCVQFTQQDIPGKIAAHLVPEEKKTAEEKKTIKEKSAE